MTTFTRWHDATAEPVAFFDGDPNPIVRLPPKFEEYRHDYEPVYDEEDMPDGSLRRELLGFRMSVSITWPGLPDGQIGAATYPGAKILAYLLSRHEFQYAPREAGPYVWGFADGSFTRQQKQNRLASGEFRFVSRDLVASIDETEDAWT